MQQEQYFRLVKASEPPKEDGDYFCLVQYHHRPEGELIQVAVEVKNGFWQLYKENKVVEYLEPIQLPDAERLREALEKIANHDKEAETLFPSITVDMFKHIARESLSAGDGWVRCEDGLPEDWSKDVWAMSKSKGEVEKMSAGNLVKYQQYYSHWHPELIPSPPIQ